MAPSYANIFMGKLEKQIIATSLSKPLSWFRFIDDVDMKWIESQQKLDDFIRHANNAHHSIKFTYEISDSKIFFLDTTTSIKDGVISTDLYCKPTDKHQYLSPQSCHPKHCTKSIPYSQLLGVKRICSSEEAVTKRLRELRGFLTKRGYEKLDIDKGFAHANNNSRNDLLQYKRKRRNKIVPFVLTYNPTFNNLSRLIRANWQTIAKHPKLSKIFPNPPVLAFRRPASLKDLFRSDNSTSTSGIARFIPTGRNQPSTDERSDNSTSTSGIARFIPTGRNQPATDEDGMAILIRPGERSRRQAAQIARNNIRGWCSNRGSSLENEAVQRNDSNTTSSIISGSSIDNQGLSVTELRSQQNEEYLQSLMADQKKEQDKKDEEERLQNDHLRQQSLVAEIQKLRNMRKESLPSEPDEGFVLKLRSGEKRRFTQSDFVQVLIDFVGCQQNATKDFEISIAGISRKINSWSSSGMLEDFGIQHSAVLEVEYDIEKPCTSINSLVHRSYNELMSSLESQDERESSEEEPMENDVPPPVRESCDIRDTILEWKLELIDLDNFQTIKVSRRPESLWEHSLRCFRRSSFDVTKLLKVEFRNESGQDEGGLRREFLEILFRQMLCSSLLKDTGDGYEVTSNMMGMVNGHFHTFGKMLGTILIQGGPVSPAFSHMMVNYGLKGLDSATIDSVEDVNCKQIISRIQDADNPEHLMEDESVMNILESAGICAILNTKTKHTIVRSLILSNSVILRKQPMLDAFWEGTECVGLKTLLQKKQDQLERILCHRCGKPPKISAEILMEMVDVSTFGRTGSNARHNSEDVAQNFESFVHDCEDGMCTYDGGVVKVDDVLRFMTGCSSVPPGGFDARFSIGFTEERKYPTVSTCTFEVVLPLHLKNYNTFKDIMIESIVSGPGFGQI
ncbi:uncharacterized protein LOC134697996 [Mytilus trossulus]|uniref:uncharacterized protein LOC134697996 n=1 Tax=Mytilus trossulus TaxID=6551 RepID=UPI00300477E3